MEQARVDLTTGHLSGENISDSKRLLGEMAGVFADEDARARMDANTVVYQVQSHACVQEGVQGGLFFGVSCVMPGQVAGEYFMTKGHFHQRRETAEYYWCIQGRGALILMDEQGKCWFEKMRPGTLHYIPGHVAHRLANTGTEVLRVGACWPSDAGHDYETIARDGFSARLMEVDGHPVLQPVRKENA